MPAARTQQLTNVGRSLLGEGGLKALLTIAPFTEIIQIIARVSGVCVGELPNSYLSIVAESFVCLSDALVDYFERSLDRANSAEDWYTTLCHDPAFQQKYAPSGGALPSRQDPIFLLRLLLDRRYSPKARTFDRRATGLINQLKRDRNAWYHHGVSDSRAAIEVMDRIETVLRRIEANEAANRIVDLVIDCKLNRPNSDGTWGEKDDPCHVDEKALVYELGAYDVRLTEDDIRQLGLTQAQLQEIGEDLLELWQTFCMDMEDFATHMRPMDRFMLSYRKRAANIIHRRLQPSHRECLRTNERLATWLGIAASPS